VNLLFRLVLDAGWNAVGIGGAEALQWAKGAGHGGHRLEMETEAAPLSLPAGIDDSRPSLDQRLRLERTPSAWRFAKETLDFFKA
jgi:hypothetical protein